MRWTDREAMERLPLAPPWRHAAGDVETYRRKLLQAYSPDRLALIALADPDAMAYLPGQRRLDADERDVYMDYVLSQALGQ